MENISITRFLESTPPGKVAFVDDFVSVEDGMCYISVATLSLYCDGQECQGFRFFDSNGSTWVKDDEHNNSYIIYYCRHCRKSIKTFALESEYNKGRDCWIVRKYGEKPDFGPPIPSRIYKLIGGERELFLMGRRSEIQGMGIGAFVYYRRVLESQRVRIFDELIKVVSKISPGDAVLQDLDLAKNETQFTKAVEAIKHALPQAIFINGYNPLTLLHTALSEGVHTHNDDECLVLASSVRTVLFEFSERLSQALKDEANLNAAVNRLAGNNSSRK